MVIVLLIAPVILAAYLLGASWGVAILIGLSFPIFALAVAFVAAFFMDAWSTRKRRKQREDRIKRHAR
jgi:uncharacterized membrane protein